MPLYKVISEQMHSLVLISKFVNRLQIKPFLVNSVKPPPFLFILSVFMLLYGLGFFFFGKNYEI